MNGYLTGAVVFVLDSLFELFIGAVLLRLLLQWVRADFYNPFCQAVVKLTNPLLRHFRRYIPSLGRLDTASVVLIVVLELFKLWLLGALTGSGAAFTGLLVLATASLISTLLYLLMFALIAVVIASWVMPGAWNPLLDVLDALTSPMLRPLRGVLPSLGGLDLSPMVALMGLQLAQMLVVTPLHDFGISLL